MIEILSLLRHFEDNHLVSSRSPAAASICLACQFDLATAVFKSLKLADGVQLCFETALMGFVVIRGGASDK